MSFVADQQDVVKSKAQRVIDEITARMSGPGNAAAAAAAAKAEEERLAPTNAEEERIAATNAEEERTTATNAEEERTAAANAEDLHLAEKKAAEAEGGKAEEERMAAEKEVRDTLPAPGMPEEATPANQATVATPDNQLLVAVSQRYCLADLAKFGDADSHKHVGANTLDEHLDGTGGTNIWDAPQTSRIRQKPTPAVRAAGTVRKRWKRPAAATAAAPKHGAALRAAAPQGEITCTDCSRNWTSKKRRGVSSWYYGNLCHRCYQKSWHTREIK